MSRIVVTEPRSQLALQSYLDALLQEAAIELESVSQDEFQAAVLEERQFDTLRLVADRGVAPPIAETAPAQMAGVVSQAALGQPAAEQAGVKPVAELEAPLGAAGTPLAPSTQPDWSGEPFECLLFDVAGLTLAVPLVSLGSIYPLAGQELTPLFGQPDWFLGILPCQAGNLKVLDTARWVMGERYRDDFRDGLQYVISVQGYEWGLAVHSVSRSIRLDPSEVKWRSQRTQRPWLAGTVIDQMCALLDVTALAELIASGATRRTKGIPK